MSSDRLRTRPDDRPVTGLGEGVVDTHGTLLLVGQAVRDRRRAEAVLLHAAALWADQHGDVGPTHDHDGYANRVIRIGGAGTPEVNELCFDDLAVMLEKHPLAARALAADALIMSTR